ncbi:glycoside hydrolase family 25 protein [Streptomyces sp. 891-h]|uniref:glycoside hydrolase family 25 protein n=1 Tax=Streptomyces sp. 891-h TaxID=2720714 RepID=UPI001FA9DAE5|nr:glycoside hydrolase family 25 protein [Streptomyces sp. 891-h]UNZ20635.1 hypothetical protein HC362_29785 [Streptomyces sp. 891-h]
MTIKGIDVSSYQSSTYSTRGYDFVFVKATEGTAYINPKMRAQADRARKAGLVVGFYHFLRPGSMSAQARYFVEKCASQHGDPLWADWEDPRVSCADKDRFLAEVKRLRGGTHKVGLYCNVDYWTRRDTTSNAGDALWIAQYNGHPGSPSIRAPWLIHQYTSTPVDTNVARFASRAAMKAWATGSSGSTQEDNMPTQKELYDGVWELDGQMAVPWGSDTNPEWKPKSVLIHVGEVARETRGRVKNLETAVAELAAKGAARDAVLAKLAEGGGLTAAEVQAAAEAGAQAALDRLGDALSADQT